MKNKIIFISFILCALFAFAAPASAEARHHYRSGPRVQLNVGNAYGNAYVVRQYAVPVVPVVYAAPPVYVASPTYVQEVYSVPAYRPFSLAGLSFSFNFGR